MHVDFHFETFTNMNSFHYTLIFFSFHTQNICDVLRLKQKFTLIIHLPDRRKNGLQRTKRIVFFKNPYFQFLRRSTFSTQNDNREGEKGRGKERETDTLSITILY